MLTAVTTLVLGTLVLLQAYWLMMSYRQQEMRFKGDVESALAATSIKVLLDKVLLAENNQLMSAAEFNNLSKVVGQQLKGKDLSSGHFIELKVDNSNLKLADTAKLVRSLSKMLRNRSAPAPQIGVTDFEESKEVFRKELASRDITTPFEIAVADEDGRIYMSTSGAEKFISIPFKTSVSNLSGKGSTGLQAAFPDVGIYLLRQLAWVLAISLLLIAIGIYSFTYLLVSFSRHRRMAEIRADLMNNMTHELKTPVSSITVALDMVLDNELNLSEHKKQAHMQAAQKEVQRLGSLVENTLDIISLENERILMNKEEILLRPFMHTITEHLALLAEKKQAVINTAGVGELCVSVDKGHIGNVLQNVIENAIKYNDKTNPVIDIEAVTRDNEVVISIADNGPGIPEKYIDKIFDKFFRVPTGDLYAVKGYGLGLSYAKTIVEMHSGTISAESIHKRGCVFIITLPMN